MPKKRKSTGKTARTDPPFSFELENFRVENNPDCIKLYPNITPDTQEIELKVNIAKNRTTGKPDYKIVYVKSKDLPKAVETVPPLLNYRDEDLNPFLLIQEETGKFFIVNPRKTGGLQPFLAVDPETRKEASLPSPNLIHYDISSGKRYLVDLRKFQDGSYTINESDNNKIVVDVTKRVDPLNGLPLHEHIFNSVNHLFIGQFKNGEIYILKDADNDQIQIFNCNGYPAIGFQTVYDSITNTSNIIDKHGIRITKIPGNITIIIPQKESLVLEERPSSTSSIEITRRNLEANETEDDKLKEEEPYKEEDNDVKKNTQLVSTNYRVLDPLRRKHLTLLKPRDVQSPMYFSARNSAGYIIALDSTGNPLPSNTLHEVVDPKTGKKVLLDNEGNPYNTEDPLGAKRVTFAESSPDLDEISARSPSIVKNLKVETLSGNESLMAIRSIHQKRDQYFEKMKAEEGRLILDQLKHIDSYGRSILLQFLREVIEFDKEIVNCMMNTKLKAEREHLQKLMRDKETRQKQFIEDYIHRNDFSYGMDELLSKLERKIERENEYILDKLEEKIKTENQLVIEEIKSEISKHRHKIVERTNKKCYQYCKRIIYKYFKKKLELQIKKVQQEICVNLKREKETLIEELMNIQTI